MNDNAVPDSGKEDAGAARHHWLIAFVVGAAFGGVGILVNWIVLRALT